MAFRDHLGAASVETSKVSLTHGMLHHSRASGHSMTIFENITESVSYTHLRAHET